MSRRSRRSVPPVAVLTVCTGNICRSPLAEQMLRMRLRDDPRFEIGSAGLHAVVGAPMDPDAATQLRAHGGDPAGLIGEQLADEHADAADLILTMTRGQRDEVVRRHPRAARRTFTLAEFAALAGSGDIDRAADPRAVIDQAGRSRSTVRLTEDQDVPDPIDATAEVHAVVASQIVGLVDTIVRTLR
ncbi:hypothetical protein JD276_10505 [Leucobacter sp. CSA1]|uniref:Phosphotyrosine protein phosphatase I domain-containing protein n=1 Tax=Leucobacter chromiisoli TaxID=2796471 RepID=A0A934UUG4_9MICO|nr:hypothetical protein [Leucobacter chromiisoli]MBK0419464.1 hypothetical protein [Leucobacter chromiisoli]